APLIFFPIMTKSQKDMWISLCQLGSLILQTRMSGPKLSKIHILLHLPESIRRFGPPNLFATEKLEIYNGILRNASIHSNRLSPGRDLGITVRYFDSMNNIPLATKATKCVKK
ncbi:hypothetical protein VP01_3195g3, partial [Puccinia sorghi]